MITDEFGKACVSSLPSLPESTPGKYDVPILVSTVVPFGGYLIGP